MNENIKDEKIEGFTEDEQKLLKIYKTEYNDLFNKILIFTPYEFMINVCKRVDITLKSRINGYSKLSRNKIEEYISNNYYSLDYKFAHIVKKTIDEKIAEGKPPHFFNGEIIEHCDEDKADGYYLHSCGSKFYVYKYKSFDHKTGSNHVYDCFLYCSKCELIYKSNLIRFKCAKTNNDFYSKIIWDSSDLDTIPYATWKKYHCNAIVNDTMKCQECKNRLFFKKLNDQNMVYCKVCKKHINPLDIIFECIICKKNFTSEAKPYNPLDYKTLKICVKDAIISKVKAKPEIIGCKCDIDLATIKFFHKASCHGELYIGEYNGQKVVICGKCDSIGKYEGYIWTCPKCFKKYRVINSKDKEYKSGEKNKHEQITNDNDNHVNENKDINDNINDNKNKGLFKRNIVCDLFHKKSVVIKAGKAGESKYIHKKSINVPQAEEKGMIGIKRNILTPNKNKYDNSCGSLSNSNKTNRLYIDLNLKNVVKDRNNTTLNKEFRKKLSNLDLRRTNSSNKKNIIYVERSASKAQKSKNNSNKKDSLSNLVEFTEKQLIRTMSQVGNLKTESSNNNQLRLSKLITGIPIKKLIFNENKATEVMKNKKIDNPTIIKIPLSRSPNSSLKNKVINRLNSSGIHCKGKNLFPNCNNSIENNKNECSNNNKINKNNEIKKNNSPKICKAKHLDSTSSESDITSKKSSVSKTKNQQNNLNNNLNSQLIIRKRASLSNSNNNLIINQNSQGQAQCQKDFNKSTLELFSTNFDIKDYEIIKQIGQGSFGKIFMVRSQSKRLYALKKLIASSQRDVKKLESEYQILLDAQKCNPDIDLVKIYGMQTKKLDSTTYCMYVLMELATIDWEKEILNRQKKRQYYSEKELMDIFAQLIKTFSMLQKINISHRDIKPQNILIFKEKNTFKPADFGEAKELYTDIPPTNKQTLRGTELYMSPILFFALRSRQRIKYINHNTYKSDVFSFGLCAFFASTLCFESLYDIRELKNSFAIKMIVERYLKKLYSNVVIELISKMLDVREEFRPDFLMLEKEFEKLGYYQGK